MFTGYREAYLETHGRQAPQDKLAYLALVACADDRATAFRRAEQMKSYFTTAARLDPQFRNPWGFNAVEANVRMLQAGPSAMRPRMRNGQPLPVDGSIEQYMDAGLFFVGTPDEVYDQLAQFHGETGGFGNLLMMGQAGELDHADTVDNLTLVAREVAPRLAELPEIPFEVRYEAVG